jgi:hypothetical protein
MQLKQHIIASKQVINELLKALLHEAFQPTETAVQADVVEAKEAVYGQ